MCLLSPLFISTHSNSTAVNDLLREELFRYAKRNLVLVNVYIKDPVVTRIKRDQKIPLIGFVANTGGLLGLCMGFSLVSAFEIAYHCILTCYRKLNRRRRELVRMASARRNRKSGKSDEEERGEPDEFTNVGPSILE